MTYLIAKKFNQPGCIAVKTDAGKELAELVSEMGKKYLTKGIQILTVSDPETFGEYKPYRFVNSVEDFIDYIEKSL